VNQRYTWANNQFLVGALNWLADTFRVVLVDTTQYQFLPAVHRNLSDIPAGAQVAISPPLTSTTAVGGVASAATLSIPAVSGAVVGAVVVFHDSGNPATSELVAYLDTANGLPLNPQGTAVQVQWDSLNGIFTL
jgi:hypothetical protein